MQLQHGSSHSHHSMRSASGKGRSYFAVSSVASVALEAEIDDCLQGIVSGEVLMSTAARMGTPGADAWVTNSRSEVATKSFVEAFGRELYRLADTLSNQRRTVESSAEALLKDANGLSRVKESGKLSNRSLQQKCKNIRKQAIDLQTKTLKIMKEATKNRKELHRIALKADSKLRTTCVEEAERDFTKEPWTEMGSAGHIVQLLSDIFSLVRDIEEDTKDKGDTWVAPQSFERVTTKYWVREEDLPEVLLKSASELPILVYGKSGLLTKNPKDPSEGGKVEFWKSMASPISSVYFDSDDLDLYRERLKRSEGANLVRVRWYGNSKPSSDSVVFLELKTHHECWIDNQSVKERINLLSKRISSLIDISDGPWTPKYAKTLVTEASGSEATEQELQTATDLLVEIRGLFLKWELKPCVRTSYTRAAFQNPKNNNLRLTIDKDITVIDEKRVRQLRESKSDDDSNDNEDSVQSSNSWCIDDSDIVPIEAFAKVPYGVFEVKVATGESPDFVQDLERSDAIVEAPKFSKFLSGVSLHNATQVETLPWWSADELFAPMYNRRTSNRRPSRQSIFDIFVVKGTPVGVSEELKLDVEEDSTSPFDYDALEQGEIIQPLTRISEKRKSSQTTSMANSAGRVLGDSSSKKQSSQKSELETLSNSSRKKGSDLDGRVSKLGRLSTSGKLLSQKFFSTRESNNSEKGAAPRSPARVEPKSFFANERTFIQWVTVGSLFMFVAGLVYTEGLSMGSRHGQSFMIFGTALIACALFVVLYGVAVYYRRVYLMINAKPYGYSDTFGPAVLGMFMIVLLSTFVYIYNTQFAFPNAMLREVEGMCVKRNLDFGLTSGISMYSFEPSAITIDEERDLLIVASLDEIVALPAGLPKDFESINAPMQILHKFEERSEDLEALEIIDGTIYAISEGKTTKNGKDQSDLISLDWTSDGHLEETERWRTNARFAEGLTYISDPRWFPEPTMVVASDLLGLVLDRQLRLKLWAYQFPIVPDGEDKPSQRNMNDKFFIHNLEDSKVTAMQFFGGLLYLLYNNARVIRAFDSRGKQVNEWNLPVGEAYYDESWEAMRLEQNGDELYLHLGLDSPPQVWTIKLEGDTSPDTVNSGQWVLPKCAS